MIARLGQVVYWGASAFALLCGALIISFPFWLEPEYRGADSIVLAGFGAVAWLAGRAVKYVLVGK